MEKTILCLYAPANSGKTSTIRLVDEMLQSRGAKSLKILSDDSDICKEYLYRNNRIGILSLGDPGSEQSDYLKQLSDDECKIIVCASRSKGSTCDAVSKIVDKSDRRYWISPLYEYDSTHPLIVDMHEVNAQFIIKSILAAINN
jgi:hypothetical protein